MKPRQRERHRERETKRETGREREGERERERERVIYLLKAYSPVNRTWSPEGFSQVQISHKLNRMQKHAYYIT